MTAPELRRAARVIVLDEADRTLLLRIVDRGRVFWATPGGSLEPGEDEEAAARREVAEELGLSGITLTPALAYRTTEHLVGGAMRRQVETYYLTRVDAQQADASHGTQTDNITARRWWQRPDIGSSVEPVYPVGLADLIEAYLTQGAPASPVQLPR
ncbi:NUDIX hydrolase [Streptomonospora nanhaiensis]|uniref:8-oxo-dGTP pyrophosphatase MutT (NUDIX family) n=1 Tax=Streptomonospora nanhaiensis TaxID=1323731 RepID=A0A853BVP4_9ACTN|nr:NUDIX domain-containing protein [Streptomonospora nanhaiensis]MBV2366205.1 NUDIX domain-containing protein [Streptomonospora nanhaiensis]NYI98282.1 8-oxo-dGTP pyrophosphatase MutT (NUDIX family) [Streptomonospora nanhaiensis]